MSASGAAMHMIAILAQTERKRQYRSVRYAEKHCRRGEAQRLRGLTRPPPAPCAAEGATRGKKPHIVSVLPDNYAAADRNAMKVPDPVYPEKSGRTKCRNPWKD